MSFLAGIFGGNQVQAPTVNVNPAGFSGGGLTGSFAGNSYGVTADPSRSAAVAGVSNTFGAQASDIANMRSQWTPGFSNLRSSLMTSLQNNRTQALGNLRDNLAQRRVLGSSFAQNSLANADQTYQQQIQQAQAQTFLQELSVQQQLSQQQYAAARGQFQTNLDEMNLEAGIATDLSSKATTAMTQAATTQAQLDMQASLANQKQTSDMLSGFGKFAGSIFGPTISGAGSSLASGLGFGGGSSIASSLGLGSGIADADLIESLALVA